MRIERREGYRLWVGGPVPKHADGITLGSLVIVREGSEHSRYLLRHEQVHVRQWRRYGVIGFGVRYLGSYAMWRLRRKNHHGAYLRIPLEIEPGNELAVVKLAELLIADDRSEEALAVLARIPETEAVRKAAAAARLSTKPDDDYDVKLASLLDQVKADEAARQEFVDILELMGPEDPRTAGYRKQLTARLF